MRLHYSNNKCVSFTFTFLHMVLLFFMTSTSAAIPTFGNESDHMALLDFKSKIINDPFKITSSWNDSVNLCDWVGVTCNSTTERVLVLNLEAQELTGSLPASLGNLTYLTEIRLGNNHFHGQIPQELGRLIGLQHLNLSFNNFGGEIPANISHCTELVCLAIDLNELVGQIPNQLFTLSKLDRLGFGGNNLSGTIPSWIGNFSSLFALSFARNNFHGTIPSELGRLTKLKFFTVYANNLTGTVPSSIFNLSSLTYFSLTQNQLEGNLPSDVGFTLPNLQIFAGGVNNFHGPVPTSLVNASGLQVLDFAENGLTGMLPHHLGSLKDLWRLNFDDNKLGSGKVGDLNLINFLANCTSLMVLGLAGNRFGGELPSSIANLSNQLTILTLGRNVLSGRIPHGIENLINLQVLGFEGNHLNGSVPDTIGKLKNLVTLNLNSNKLSNLIPSSIGNLSLLTKLFMENNGFEGTIPASLGKCTRLLALDLSHNSLSGTIPKEVFGLSSLSIYMALSYNSLIGSLPSEVGELVSLTMLDVSENRLSGNIPGNIGKCTSLERLLLGGNRFVGKIPQPLEALRGLTELNLSKNNLSGQIPKFLGKFVSLKHLDLSYNDLEGEVPKEGVFSNSTMFFISRNKYLCDGLQELHLPPCLLSRSRTHSFYKFRAQIFLICILGAVVFLVLLLSIAYVCFIVKTRKKTLTLSSSEDVLAQMSYMELHKSTNGFSSENLIGSGSFGSVYRGILLSGGSIVVAIKVLNLHQQGASKSFIDECKALTTVRHRNLLKIITSCSSVDERGNEFKALVFDFISNGNLDSWLHPVNPCHNQNKRLSLIQRLNIAIDIANALDYLHNNCETPIVHCDLKPSNVLLDEDFVARVGDFGLAKFILEGPNQSLFKQTMSLALKGSIGYIPPEYGTGGKISIQGDIYSYGILLLEMLTGKRPTDDTFGDGLNIHMFTAMSLPQRALDIVDSSLLSEEAEDQEEQENEDKVQEIAITGNGSNRREEKQRSVENCLISLMRIGLSCSSVVPRERTPMNIVTNQLQAIRSSYLKF